MRQSKSGILKWSTEKFLRYFWWESWSRSFWFEINGWQFYLENQKEQHGLGRVSHPLLRLTRSVQLSDIEYGTCLKTFWYLLRIMENLEKTRTWQQRTQAGLQEVIWFYSLEESDCMFWNKIWWKWSSNDNVEKIFPASAEENNQRGQNSFKRK